LSKPLESYLCPFSPFVILPTRQCRLDVSLLAFLRSAANKNYEPVAILAEVNSVTRTKIDPVLKQAGPGALSA